MNPFRPGSNSRKGRTIWKKISEELLLRVFWQRTRDASARHQADGQPGERRKENSEDGGGGDMDSSGSEDEQDREEDIALVENGAAPSRTLGRGVKKTSKNIGIDLKRFRALTAADKICGVMTRMSDAENERLRVREAAELDLKKAAQRQEDRRLELQEMELETKRQQLKLDRERMEFDRLRWEAALNKY
ncbi:hypothetical protein BV898_06058 [Hypsibius exemplaris]|uniref:No apical meristem-associated C-terminal domain-containing protein n=1 Tax=Hypsibius exemplaris TaxID=2072580 RepID=A0A1W0WX57_HYPEX|nr:hypothetical protein BV898_06058 [Hypsibius exemplaris]